MREIIYANTGHDHHGFYLDGKWVGGSEVHLNWGGQQLLKNLGFTLKGRPADNKWALDLWEMGQEFPQDIADVVWADAT